MKLFKHNQKAFAESKKLLEKHDKCCVVQATGTGKSYVALALIIDFVKKNNSFKVMYIVPSIGVLNEIKDIIEKENLTYLYNNVDFYTYQNISTNENISKNSTCKLLILDEFHHVSQDAPVWKNSVDQIIENNNGIKVFGMSATPVREYGTSKEEDVCHTFFESNVAYSYSLAQAIKDKALPFPTYISTDIVLLDELLNLDYSINSGEPINKVKQKIESLKRKIASDSLPEMFALLKNYLKKDGKYIYFSSPGTSIVKIKSDIENLLGEMDGMDYEIYTVHSDYSPKYNSEVISEFKNSKKNKCRIIISVNMLNEGMHIEGLDGVILGRFTKSNQVFYQQIGRALSVYSSQNSPLIIDIVGNLKQMKKLMSEYEIISTKRVLLTSKNNIDNKAPTFFGIKQSTIDVMDDVESLSQISKHLFFKEKMVEAYEYLIKYNKFPEADYKFSDGTLMYDWFKRNKKNILSLSKTNNLAKSLSEELIKVNGFYYHTPTEVFEEKLKFICAFIKENNFIPEYSDKTISFSDNTLVGDFLSKNKKYIFQRSDVLCNDLKNIILKTNPNFFKMNDEIFLEKTKVTLDIIKRLQRVPKHTDLNLKFDDGAYVYSFLRNSSTNFEIYQNDASVQELLSLVEELDPNYLIGYEKLFIRKVILIYENILSRKTELLNFSRKPLVSDKTLYAYLNNHKHRILNSDNEHAKKLVELINEINEYYFFDEDERFEKKVVEIYEIISKIKFVPLSFERQILMSNKARVGLFLSRNKNKIYNSESIASKNLVELIKRYNPNYFVNSREMFFKKVEEFTAYIKENKSIPTKTNTEILFSDKTQLGRFYYNNKENFEIYFDNEKVVYLKCLILKIDPYYFLTVKEITRKKFEYIKDYLLATKTLPVCLNNTLVFPDGSKVSRFLFSNKKKIYENRCDGEIFEELYSIITKLSLNFFKSTEILSEEEKKLNPVFREEVERNDNNERKVRKLSKNI